MVLGLSQRTINRINDNTGFCQAFYLLTLMSVSPTIRPRGNMDKKSKSIYAVPLRELLTCMKWDEKKVRDFLSNQKKFPVKNTYVPIPPLLVRELFRPAVYVARTIAFINLKGGVGKTVSAASTATRAAQFGFKTCMLDMDMQASLTLLFNAVPDDDDPIFYDVFQDPAQMAVPSLRTLEEFLYIMPSSLENGLLDAALAKPAAQKNAVRAVCDVLRRNHIDLVVIDCPPSLGTAVISSICAADTVVITVNNDTFSLKGLRLTLQEMTSICDTFGIKRPNVKILFTRYDKRQKMTHDIYRIVSQDYPQHMSPAVINTSTDFSKAIADNTTVFASPRKSQAKADYDLFVRDLLDLDGQGLRDFT